MVVEFQACDRRRRELNDLRPLPTQKAPGSINNSHLNGSSVLPREEQLTFISGSHNELSENHHFSQLVKIKYNMCFHFMVPGENVIVALTPVLAIFK